jgi:hypothetical protein
MEDFELPDDGFNIEDLPEELLLTVEDLIVRDLNGVATHDEKVKLAVYLTEEQRFQVIYDDFVLARRFSKWVTGVT